MKRILILTVLIFCGSCDVAWGQSGGRLNVIKSFNYKAITAAKDTTVITTSSFVPIYGYVKCDSAGTGDTCFVYRDTDTTQMVAALTTGTWFNFTGFFAKKLTLKMKTGTGRVTMSVQ